MNQTSNDNVQQIDYWQVVRNHWGVIALTFIMSLVTAFVITTLMTPQYASETKFIVFPDNVQKETRSATAGAKLDVDKNFLGTQIASMKSVETLRMVDGGENARTYTKQLSSDYNTALTQLASRIGVENEIGTSIVSVRARAQSKEQARDLANSVREKYVERRKSARKEKSGVTIEKLRKELADAERKKKDAWTELTKSSKDSGLPFLKDKLHEVPNPAKVNYENLTVQKLEKENELKRLEKNVKMILSMDDANFVHYLSGGTAIIEKPRVTMLYNDIQKNKAERSSLIIQGYGPKHIVVKEVDKVIELDSAELTLELKSARGLITNNLDEERAGVNVIRDLHKLAKSRYDEFTELFNAHSQKIEDFTIAKDDLDRLRKDYDSLESEQRYFNDPIQIEQPALLPEKQHSPNIPLIMGIGSAAGLVFGLGIAFLLELMDSSVKTMEDVERYLGVPVLAVVPQDVGLLFQQDGASPDAEAYRILRTNIEFNRKNPLDNAISVVSGGAGEGKSTTILNLAYICAQGGYTTLLIDGDLRRPSLHTYLALDNSVGLSNYLTTDTPLENVIHKTTVDNLFFLPSGVLPHDAAGILNSRRMTEMLAEVKKSFDLVFVDSPPILGVSDASVISSEVDHTMIVVQHRKLPRKLLLRVKQAVESVGGNIIGVVLNNVDVRSDTEYQYYTSYYTYYSSSANAKSEVKQAKAPNTQSGSEESLDSKGDLY